MSGLKIIGFIAAGIIILFGMLFILGALSPQGQTGWLITGSILSFIGFGIIWFTTRIGAKAGDTHINTTIKIDLPADVDVERFKCQDCGAQLTMDAVKMVAGAPMVECPYCNAAYQLTEEPKW